MKSCLLQRHQPRFSGKLYTLTTPTRAECICNPGCLHPCGLVAKIPGCAGDETPVRAKHTPPLL